MPFEFSESTHLEDGTQEIRFKEVSQDGINAIGRLTFDLEQPTVVIVEEQACRAESSVRRFDHGTPENVLTVVRFDWAAGLFMDEVREEKPSRLKSELHI
jgi:hypothetical protein